MSDKSDKAVFVPPPRRPSHGRTIIALVLSTLFFSTLLHPTSRSYHPACRAYNHLWPNSVEERASKILSETPLIDGHNDFPLLIRYLFNNHIYDKSFTAPFEGGQLPAHVDLARLRAGKNGGAFWSVYVPCPANGSDYSDENYYYTVQFTDQQIDVVTRLSKAYPKDFSSVTLSSKDALNAFKEGKLISPIGVEGLHSIGNSVANLRRFYAAGARYATLTHNCGNNFADAAIWESPMFGKAPPYWGGLSPLGKKLVHEMNRIGMIVDLAHVSVDTMMDVLGGREFEGSKAPIMFSHSSAFAICPHPRNVPDEVLQLVKKTNSIVMVNFSPDFISCVDNGNENGIPDPYPENNTLAQVAKHITYIGDLIGYDHVGLGSDFDGIPGTPEGLGDVSMFPNLIVELLKNGVSDKDAAKIVGGNILRVWKAVEDVAAQMQADGFPVLEDDLPSLRVEENIYLQDMQVE